MLLIVLYEVGTARSSNEYILSRSTHYNAGTYYSQEYSLTQVLTIQEYSLTQVLTIQEYSLTQVLTIQEYSLTQVLTIQEYSAGTYYPGVLTNPCRYLLSRSTH